MFSRSRNSVILGGTFTNVTNPTNSKVNGEYPILHTRSDLHLCSRAHKLRLIQASKFFWTMFPKALCTTPLSEAISPDATRVPA